MSGSNRQGRGPASGVGAAQVDSGRGGEGAGARPDPARKRAAIELIRRHEPTLRHTARRYSICTEDAEDALQRALEILLTKAPTTDPRQLIRWMQTVTKREALAVRRQRERILARPRPQSQDTAPDQDWIALIPSQSDGPADLAERRERVARTREALSTLKPHELRALTLLAEGYSYSEIGEITGWSYTYSFADDESRGVAFEFRARVPRESNWPYTSGHSPPRRVRVR